MLLQAWLKSASQQITEKIEDNPLFEARLIAEKVCGLSQSQLRWEDPLLSAQQLEQLNSLLQRRLKKEPIAYVLGYQPFFNLELNVNEHTLIPRPETEELVTIALSKIPKEGKILDLGTGSGAIACAIAHQRKDCFVIGVDKSAAALAIAQENAKKYHLHNTQWIISDWFDNIKTQDFDTIISNPPYIAPNDEHLDALTYEPLQALVSEENGYADLKKIIDQSYSYLKYNGHLILEHGYEQADFLHEYAHQSQHWKAITTIQDLGYRDRITLMQKI